MDRGTPGIHAIDQYLRAFSKQYRAACTRGNVAAVHELRVNARRLRSTLKTYSSLYHKKEIKKLGKLFQEAAAQVSELRDLDVYIQFLVSYKNKIKSKSGQVCAREYISAIKNKRQALLYGVTRRLIQSRPALDTRKIIRAIKKQARRPQKQSRESLLPVFKERILKTVREILEYGPIVHHPDRKTELHEMRIKAKHLRYTLEGVGRYYDSRIKAYTAQSLFLHKILGEIHDYDVWISMVRKDRSLRKPGAPMKQTLKHLQKYCQRMRSNSYHRFVQRWDKLNKNRFFEDLLEFIYAHR